jgi:hypothetical protein
MPTTTNPYCDIGALAMPDHAVIESGVGLNAAAANGGVSDGVRSSASGIPTPVGA